MEKSSQFEIITLNKWFLLPFDNKKYHAILVEVYSIQFRTRWVALVKLQSMNQLSVIFGDLFSKKCHLVSIVFFSLVLIEISQFVASFVYGRVMHICVNDPNNLVIHRPTAINFHGNSHICVHVLFFCFCFMFRFVSFWIWFVNANIVTFCLTYKISSCEMSNIIMLCRCCCWFFSFV